ncbi:MAG TPA: flavin reductase family protein [Rugosimonospora sp.]|nr:flavin reductase family protein [Rugosimonospora sp.]
MDGLTPPTDPMELRRVFSCFPSGVTAACALVDGVPVGMAASTFVPVSMDPPLVSLCVQAGSRTWSRLRWSGQLGISVLAGKHELACRSLSDKDGDRFKGVGWRVVPGGAVFIDGAVAWLACRLHAELPAGDHVIALLRILGVHADTDGEPLVFHRSRYRQLAVA